MLTGFEREAITKAIYSGQMLTRGEAHTLDGLLKRDMCDRLGGSNNGSQSIDETASRMLEVVERTEQAQKARDAVQVRIAEALEVAALVKAAQCCEVLPISPLEKLKAWALRVCW